jgi:hypothetical protein
MEKEFPADNRPWNGPDSLRRSLDKMLLDDAKPGAKTRRPGQKTQSG